MGVLVVSGALFVLLVMGIAVMTALMSKSLLLRGYTTARHVGATAVLLVVGTGIASVTARVILV